MGKDGSVGSERRGDRGVVGALGPAVALGPDCGRRDDGWRQVNAAAVLALKAVAGVVGMGRLRARKSFF